eukprot:1563388-Lingulodinium_polyedra.AAC.1
MVGAHFCAEALARRGRLRVAAFCFHLCHQHRFPRSPPLRRRSIQRGPVAPAERATGRAPLCVLSQRAGPR